MNKLMIVALLVLMVGCGKQGGSNNNAGSQGPAITIKLINSTTGNTIRDGVVEVFVLTYKFVSERTSDGGCCAFGSEANTVTLGKGSTNEDGGFSFVPNEANMPLTENLIVYDFTNAHPFGDTPAEVNAFFSGLNLTPPGYYVSGDGPGFFETTKKLKREAFIAGENGSTVSVPLKPI